MYCAWLPVYSPALTQRDWYPAWQISHVLSESMNEPITKSPSSRVATSVPFSTIVPTYSWPMRRWSTSLWPR